MFAGSDVVAVGTRHGRERLTDTLTASDSFPETSAGPWSALSSRRDATMGRFCGGTVR